MSCDRCTCENDVKGSKERGENKENCEEQAHSHKELAAYAYMQSRNLEWVFDPFSSSGGYWVPTVNLQETLDAALWAKTFCAYNPTADESYMLGWFSNAIEAGKCITERNLKQKEVEAVDKVDVANTTGNKSGDQQLEPTEVPERKMPLVYLSMPITEGYVLPEWYTTLRLNSTFREWELFIPATDEPFVSDTQPEVIVNFDLQKVRDSTLLVWDMTQGPSVGATVEAWTAFNCGIPVIVVAKKKQVLSKFCLFIASAVVSTKQLLKLFDEHTPQQLTTELKYL
jgi:hypothetical protein